MKLRAGEAGFSLIELLVVMGMIAIIITIALPQFIRYVKLSYKTQVEAGIKDAYTAA